MSATPSPLPAGAIGSSNVDGGDPLPSAARLASAGKARGKSPLHGINLRTDKRGLSESIAALGRAFETREASGQIVADFFPEVFHRVGDDCWEFSDQRLDLLFVVRGHIPTPGAGELVMLVQPSERYGEMMAAIARDLKLEIVDVHGWPVLSVGVGTSTVSEAAGESIPGGGAAS